MWLREEEKVLLIIRMVFPPAPARLILHRVRVAYEVKQGIMEWLSDDSVYKVGAYKLKAGLKRSHFRAGLTWT